MGSQLSATEADAILKRQGCYTVADLIDELTHLPPEARVVFQSDYGDICHTQQALPVCHVTTMEDEGGTLAKNEGYSRSGLELCEPDEPEEDEDGKTAPPEDDEPPQVVILS